MFVAAGLSGSEMAHQGVMGFALLVMAIISVKFPDLRLATQPSITKAQKLPRQREGRDVLDLLASHHHLCLS